MWKAITRDGQLLSEADGIGRPVDLGNEGGLVVIAEEEFGKKVAVDLVNGAIAFDYDSLGIQNGTIELDNPKVIVMICEETNVVGDYRHLEQRFEPSFDKDGNQLYENNKPVHTRTDYLTPLIWRPIWFTRTSSGIVTKVIGAQTTTPDMQGARNVKKLVSLFEDGRIGID